jgi:ankyrin repeat protein
MWIASDQLEAALALACSYGELEDATQLLRDWGDLNPVTGFQALKSLLDLAASNGHGGIVRLLLRRGINMDASTLWAAFEAEEISLGRSIPVFEAFIEVRSWDVNDNIGNAGTPLEFAVVLDHREVAQWMIDKGANPNNGRIRAPYTTLAWACQDSSLSMVELLLQNGASIAGSGAMHSAAKSGRTEVLAFLFENGADINEIPTMSWIRADEPRLGTPLHAAVKGNQRSAVGFLLTHGADASVMDSDGKTAFQVARENGSNELEGFVLFDHSDAVE